MSEGSTGRHGAILLAALEVFAAHGFAGTSLDQIAATAHVSRQTVYNHFPDKEAVFLAAMDAAITEQLDRLRAATGLVPPPKVEAELYLIELAQRIIGVFSSPAAATTRLLVQSELPRHPGLRDLWRERAAVPVWSSLIGHLALLAHRRQLRIHDPVEAAGQYIALVVGAGWVMTDLGTFAAAQPADEEELAARVRANVAVFVRAHR